MPTDSPTPCTRVDAVARAAPNFCARCRARNALARQIGIELKRMPADRHAERRVGAAEIGERRLELALADEAPRTHDVGHDVDDEPGCLALSPSGCALTRWAASRRHHALAAALQPADERHERQRDRDQHRRCRRDRQADVVVDAGNICRGNVR
jgi:hypothetical protein